MDFKHGLVFAGLCPIEMLKWTDINEIQLTMVGWIIKCDMGCEQRIILQILFNSKSMLSCLTGHSSVANV